MPVIKPNLTVRLSFRQVRMGNFGTGFGHLILDTSWVQLMNSILIFLTVFFCATFLASRKRYKRGQRPPTY